MSRERQRDRETERDLGACGRCGRLHVERETERQRETRERAADAGGSMSRERQRDIERLGRVRQMRGAACGYFCYLRCMPMQTLDAPDDAHFR